MVEEDAAEQEEPTDGTGSILIVEDDEAVCNLFCDIFKERGYDVVAALNGQDALAQLQQNGPVDLLLTDIVLPKGMNGIELAQRVTETAPATRVIVMTAYSENDIAGKGLSVSGYRLLHKPMRINEMVQAVADVFENGDG